MRIALLFILALPFSISTHAASIKLSCGAVGQELALCKKHAQAWADKTGNTVEVISTPNDASQRLALYQQVLGARSDRIDVFQIDVVWPGLLGAHLADLAPYTKGVEKQHFAGIIANNTVDGRLVAMPMFVDAGLLYYRKDLLKKYKIDVPQTWEHLAASARKIQDAERAAGNAAMWGYVWQGRAYEGLTCNALEWIVSFGGGTIVDASGTITINNPNAVRALDTAATWVDAITPKAVLNYAEEEARGVFQAGNAVYLRNWPYAWALAQKADSPIKDKVGVTVLPRGDGDGRHAATLGGQLLAVSKYTKHLDAAASLALYMTGTEVQKSRALEGSFNPTLAALYKDKNILKANPFMGELADTFTSAVGRPAAVTGAQYNQVSNEFWNAAHDVLAGKRGAESALADLDKRLQRIQRGGKWNR